MQAASVFLSWHFAPWAAFAIAGNCFLAFNLLFGWQRAGFSSMRVAMVETIFVTTSFASYRRKIF
jgi:hypothetical protein